MKDVELGRKPSPKEIADETLHQLCEFSTSLISLSEQSSRLLTDTGDDAAFQHTFLRLIDGLEVFMDGITTSRAVLGAGGIEAVQALEESFVAITNELVLATRTRNEAHRIQILQEVLPVHLREWAEKGIPQLIRSRDS
ncbi:hypothetical protein K2X30_08255 [bacterium]|jgi:hypothetical protein|nr:hypothetical protein [bacterium]